MSLLPDAQSNSDSNTDLDECVLCVNESEFLALIDSLVAAMRGVHGG